MADLDSALIAAMHFQRHYEPIAMGTEWWEAFILSSNVPKLGLNFLTDQYMANAVAELCSTLVTFTRASDGTVTGDDGLLDILGTNVKRLDHDLTGLPLGLLMEETRTNNTPSSEELDNTLQWSRVLVTVNVDTVTAPDGATTADEIEENITTNNFHRLFSQQNSVLTVDPYTCSIFLKENERNWFKIRFDISGQFDGVFFNVAAGAGAVGTAVGSATGTIEEFASDWWRCKVTRTMSVADGLMGPHLATADGTDTYAGVVGDGAYGWGAQIEKGTFATAYIPTTTTDETVTRASETAVAATSGWDFSTTAGSLLVIVTPNHTPTAEMVLALLSDGTANEKIEIYADAAANIKFRVVDGGAEQCDIDSGVNAAAGVVVKIAVAWELDDFAISVNGNTVVADTLGTLPVVTQLEPCENGHTQLQIAYNVRVANADLEAVST